MKPEVKVNNTNENCKKGKCKCSFRRDIAVTVKIYDENKSLTERFYVKHSIHQTERRYLYEADTPCGPVSFEKSTITIER